jgi:hypothetical protein
MSSSNLGTLDRGLGCLEVGDTSGSKGGGSSVRGVFRCGPSSAMSLFGGLSLGPLQGTSASSYS